MKRGQGDGASHGDAATEFAETYAAFYGRVVAYAARRVGPEAADEVAAETFLVAWRRFEVIPDEPLAWLYGVARNVVARHRAAGARRQAAFGALERERPPGEPADGGDTRLWDAWERLRDGDREVLALVAWEELPVRDAARALGIPASVFSLRLHRARRRFERLLVPSEDASRPPSEGGSRPASEGAAHSGSHLTEAS
jgi:RNA polymerase sigma-70 factor (ECF subfamily)